LVLDLTSSSPYGTEEIGVTGSAQLGVITDGALSDITPRQTSTNVAAAASATSGSSFVIITDATVPGITQFNSVYIATQISVGGVVLFGLYQCDPDGYLGGTTYSVQVAPIYGAIVQNYGTAYNVTTPSANTTIKSAVAISFLQATKDLSDALYSLAEWTLK
jgi:hypothetical protein